ncbi:MAG TPA: glycosyltransferase, partial [Vicinamibacterales bacterium]
MMPRTVVVVPCFNEASRLDGEAFAAAVDVYPGLEFLFVDDGSTDGTAQVLERLVARNPERLAWLKLPQNSGKAEAVRQGMLAAFAANPDLVGFLDADLATPISELTSMAAMFEDEEVLAVLASRVAMLGRDIRRSTWRHYTGRVFATLASTVLDLQVYDTQCGAKLFRNTPVVQEVFASPFLSSWAFDVEILARMRELHRAGQIPDLTRVVVEVPLKRWMDVRGSKISLTDSIIATSQVLMIGWRYRNRSARSRVESASRVLPGDAAGRKEG